MSMSRSSSDDPVRPLPALRRFFRNYARFRGGAVRSEFWWPVGIFGVAHWLIFISALITVDVWFADEVIAETGGGSGGLEYRMWFEGGAAVAVGIAGMLHLAILAATVMPFLAVTWRRLHDVGRSGGWFFIVLIPVLGWIILAVMCALTSKKAD